MSAWVQFPVPWPEPDDRLCTDLGPAAPVSWICAGARLTVSPTAQVGCDTGRRRYRVECETCCEVLHEATTSPRYYIEQHLIKAHIVITSRR